jgi:hypothetical protein
VLKNFAHRAGLGWGQGLGWGGGGMISMISPLGSYPFKNLGRELDILAQNILAKQTDDDRYSHPSIPRFFYKTSANLMWFMLAFKNKLKCKDLYERLETEPERKPERKPETERKTEAEIQDPNQ